MAKRSMTPEGTVKAAVMGFLRDSGAFYMRMNSGKVSVKGGFMQLHAEGTADILVFKGAQPFWIELKGVGQTTNIVRVQKQAKFAEKVKALGHRHIQATTVEEVIEFLK